MERQDPTVTANEEDSINQVRKRSAPLNHERLKEQKAGEKDQRHLPLGWTGSQASEEVAKDNGGRRGGIPPPENRSAWSERKQGVKDGMEPESPSTYLLMYLQNMEKKEISKSIQTQSTISLIANAKFSIPKTPKNKVKTAQLQKKKLK